MSTVAIGLEISTPAKVSTPPKEGPPRKRWTRAECILLEESGLWVGLKFELVDGELYNTMGKNRPHASALTLIRDWLVGIFGGVFVNTETSIDVRPEDNPTNEPEPDLIVLSKRTQEFAASPTPKDIRLLVEVSDTTLHYDRYVKGPLYARAGIAEYWVLDVNARSLIVHREPAGEAYGKVDVFAEQEAVVSGVVTRSFTVGDFLQ